MWESRPIVGEIPKGLVERVGSLVLAFHAFHAPAFPQLFIRLLFALAVFTGRQPAVSS
jgi:hypothetical protein